MPLLEAVEHAALRAGVPVDARIEKGRTPDPRAPAALGRRAVRPDRRPGADRPGGGFTAKDLTWILTHAPERDDRPQAEPERHAAARA